MTIWDGCSFASRGAVCQATYGIGTAARALLPDGISGASEPAKEVMLPVELVVWKMCIRDRNNFDIEPKEENLTLFSALLNSKMTGQL